jgi:type II secretory pathway pseudopilin PulG
VLGILEAQNDGFIGKHSMIQWGGIERRRALRAYSLLELMLGLVIVSIFLGMTVITLRQSIDQEGPKALAYTLASDIKAARAEAQRSGKLVAYCLPSDGKTNSFSQNAVVRKGEQRGHILRLLNYGREYNGYIYAGSWPGSGTESHDTTIGWSTDTADELAIFFRPDGTAFSNDIPSLEGNYPLVVGSTFLPTEPGPNGTLNAVQHPHTVWVSQAGTVTLQEKTVPVGVLPPGGSAPVVANLDYLSDTPAPTAPQIRDIKFLPEKLVGLDSVGMGQNYVNVHPDQKESERLEYGIATMHIKATDHDGGPVYYKVEAFASDGGVGKFSVSQESGAMAYVYDEGDRQYYWQALVSWRPPPGAEEDTEYELKVTVIDEQGRTDSTASGAGLLPVINTLTPVRMVMAAQDGHLYLANVDGGSCIELTNPGQPEREPFFSQDGSRIYSFHDVSGGGQQFRVRNADGSRQFRVLRNFGSDVTPYLRYDPSYQYVAYADPGSSNTVNYPYEHPFFVRTDDDGDGYWELRNHTGSHTGQRLEVLHLLADEPPVTITTTAEGHYYWDARQRHTLVYNHAVVQDTTSFAAPNGKPAQPLGPYIASPGYKVPTNASTLVGFPPTKQPYLGTTTDSTQQSYNPANDRLFVHYSGGALVLSDRAGANHGTVHSGTILGTPHWSSNGQYVAFVIPQGSSNKVVVKRLLESDLSIKSSFETRFEYSGPGVKNAQLAPTAKWVFFLEGGNLYRAVNSRGASRVNLSDHLGKSLDSYVVSP